MLGSFEPIAFVHTADVDRARTFYVGVLGLTVVEESPFALVVRSGHTIVRITPVPSHAPAGATVLGWQVPDVHATLEALAAQGVVGLRFDGLVQDDPGVWRAPGGAQVAWFHDPDANILSLTEV